MPLDLVGRCPFRARTSSIRQSQRGPGEDVNGPAGPGLAELWSHSGIVFPSPTRRHSASATFLSSSKHCRNAGGPAPWLRTMAAQVIPQDRPLLYTGSWRAGGFLSLPWGGLLFHFSEGDTCAHPEREGQWLLLQYWNEMGQVRPEVPWVPGWKFLGFSPHLIISTEPGELSGHGSYGVTTSKLNPNESLGFLQFIVVLESTLCGKCFVI